MDSVEYAIEFLVRLNPSQDEQIDILTELADIWSACHVKKEGTKDLICPYCKIPHVHNRKKKK